MSDATRMAHRNSTQMAQRVIGILAAFDKRESVLSVNHATSRRCGIGRGANRKRAPPNFAKRLDANREQRLLIFVEKYGASGLKFQASRHYKI